MVSSAGALIVFVSAVIVVIAVVWKVAVWLDRRRFEDMRSRPLPHLLSDSLAGLEPRLAEPSRAEDFDFERWRSEVVSGRFQWRRPVETDKVRRIRRAG